MITAAIGGAAALGGAIYGAIASSKYNNKARALIQQQRDDNRRWYETRMSQDYTQRTDAQALINRQRELLNEHYKRARATGVVAGATDESVALQKEAANDAMAQTMSDIASNASAYKDSVEQQYRAQDAALNQQQAASFQQQGQAAAQAGSQLANAGINLVGVGLQKPGTGAAAGNKTGIVNQGNAAARAALPQPNTQGKMADFTPNLQKPAGDITIIGKKRV